MSEWHEVTKEDLSIDDDELNIAVFQDDFGVVYASIKIEELKEFIKESPELNQD